MSALTRFASKSVKPADCLCAALPRVIFSPTKDTEKDWDCFGPNSVHYDAEIGFTIIGRPLFGRSVIPGWGSTT